MRILHVVEATTAGVRRHVYTLASTIDHRRYTALVACPPLREHAFGDAGFVGDLVQAGIAVHTVPLVRAITPAADVRALTALVALIRAERVDLVHAHSSKAGVLGRLAARVAGVASIYTPHGLYFLGVHNPLKRQVFRQIERVMAGLSDRIIAVSPGERAVMIAERIALSDQVVCIENGIIAPQVCLGSERVALRAELGVEGDGPLIGTVARLSAQKNPRLFLEAAALLRQKLPTARFLWCGSGELLAHAQQWAATLGIANAVTFLGHREDAHAVIAACDQFWLTSEYEGLPTVLLEAMALAVPIVATDVVGTHDVLQAGGGLLVPHGNPAAIANAALLLNGQPGLRATLIACGTRAVRERWNAARMLRETEALYTAVLAEQTASSHRKHRVRQADLLHVPAVSAVAKTHVHVSSHQEV